ncbi:hypothetical protein ABMA28_007558 [Loxostege sticticalis]|uniref:Peptidase M14 domain-containing protein n=1 Tax=Loxostege sticticalis TaxID=481309 RepID=A0ABD0SHY1_LOXSC
MNAKVVALVVIFVTNFRLCQSRRYDNFTLFEVIPTEPDHLKFLQNLETQKYIDMMFWKKPVKLFHEVHFIVNPVDVNLFLERARHYRMHATILANNVQRLFDDQKIKRYLRLRVETFSWDYYHTLEDIYQWLQDLAQKFPSLVELYTIGKSFEDREMFAIGIRRGSSEKSAVIVEGGIHGSEWISIEFVTYLTHQLIHCNESSEWMLCDLAQKYDWYLIPVVNPDGYDFSIKTDRLWRKNRSPNGEHFGVDLNRNFDYSFGKFASSFYMKDEEYCGAFPFSEPEVEALSKFVDQRRKRLQFYFAFHGYGQKIVIPLSDRINHVGDYGEMENYAKQAIMKMYTLYKTKYAVGTFYDTLGFRISGNSASWVKKSFRVKYVYTVMLRDNGTYGFALPPDQIIPTCKEALAGMVVMMTARPRRVKQDLFSSASRLSADWLLLCAIILMME